MGEEVLTIGPMLLLKWKPEHRTRLLLPLLLSLR